MGGWGLNIVEMVPVLDMSEPLYSFHKNLVGMHGLVSGQLTACSSYVIMVFTHELYGSYI